MEDECSFIRHQLVQVGFRNLETYEGEMLGLFTDQNNRLFSRIQETGTNQTSVYDYMEQYAENPMPEDQAENFLYFSFVSNASEIKIMMNLFGNSGRTKTKRLKNIEHFHYMDQYRDFMRECGFGRTFLFKLPKMLKAFIDSGNGNFLGTLVLWLFNQFQSSLLKSDSKNRSIYYEAEKKIEIPKGVMETLKFFKEKNQRKLEAGGYADMNNKRIIGNHVIKTRIFKERILEEATMFNHLENMVFNLQAENVVVNYNYGVFSHALEVFAKDSFNK